MMTEQECLDYIAKYRQESVTKYDFYLQSFIEDAAGYGCYASLQRNFHDDSLAILGVGKDIRAALENLVIQLAAPSNQRYKTTDFTLPEYNHE